MKTVQHDGKQWGLNGAYTGLNMWDELGTNCCSTSFSRMDWKNLAPRRSCFLKRWPVVKCYVDDCITYADVKDAKTEFRWYTSRDFNVKDLGIDQQLLRIKLDWTKNSSLQLDQDELVETFLKQGVMMLSNPTKSSHNPSKPHHEVFKSEWLSTEEHSPHKKLWTAWYTLLWNKTWLMCGSQHGQIAYDWAQKGSHVSHKKHSAIRFKNN